ncbi:MAG: DUF1330 domain-containing protein [Burkholderiaceae bacterium]|jgi:uncharacterized protein (DUF1330 family)|nr:DUF1330 domain-containing protein [Burkholderiaceae bacterium]
MPKAYVMVQMNVLNLEKFREDYAPKSPATIEKYGGRYIVRGGEITTLEGELPYGRVAILEFPDKAAALAWYKSPEYQSIIGGRHRNSEGILSVIEGV